MKPNIHPENYRTVLFFDSGANEGWLIRSCASHPVYTGKRREFSSEGRASKFQQRFQGMMNSLRKDK